MASPKDDERIDESLEETFPASDPTTPVQPGSLASEEYPAEAKASMLGAGPKIALVALGFLIGYIVRHRR